MKILALMGLCLLLNGCSNGDTFHRGYVISKSQVETESEAEPGDPDFNQDISQEDFIQEPRLQ